MTRKLLASIFIIATTFFISNCGKPHNTPPTTPTTPSNSCPLVSETVTGGPGYGDAWTYQYDADGNLTKGSSTAKSQLAVSGNTIGIGLNNLIFTYSYVGDLKGGTPSSGYMDFTDDGTGYPKYEEYIFGYDSKKRMTSAAIKAGTINIKYDDSDNVIQMSFIANNGPRLISPIVTVEGYDHNPSPYAANPRFWIFTQQMRSWSYFSEYRIIAALSKNNPGKITTNYVDDPTSLTVDNISYQYNDKNMPASAIVQRTFRNSTTSYQSNYYGYDCQ